MGTIFMNRGNSKTSESHRFDLTNKLSLKCPKKNMTLTNLSIYYTWKNIKSATRISNNKFLLQLGMILLIYQMMLFYCRHRRLLLIYHQQHETWRKILPYKFIQIKSKPELFSI